MCMLYLEWCLCVVTVFCVHFIVPCIQDGIGKRIKLLDISGNIHLEILELPEKTLVELRLVRLFAYIAW